MFFRFAGRSRSLLVGAVVMMVGAIHVRERETMISSHF